MAVRQLLTQREIDGLRVRGWDFMPTGPESWEWLKFHKETVVNRQHDSAWASDLKEINDVA